MRSSVEEIFSAEISTRRSAAIGWRSAITLTTCSSSAASSASSALSRSITSRASFDVARLDRLQRLGQQLLAEPAHFGDLGLNLDEVLVEARNDMRHSAPVLPVRPPAPRPRPGQPRDSARVYRAAATRLWLICDGFVKPVASGGRGGSARPRRRRSRLGRPRRGVAGRQPDGEGAALAGRRDDLEPPLVAVEDVLDDGEAEPGAALVAARGDVDAVEPLGQPVDVLARDARAVVGDGDAVAVGMRLARRRPPTAARCARARRISSRCR